MSMHGESYLQTIRINFTICPLLGYIVLLDYNKRDKNFSALSYLIQPLPLTHASSLAMLDTAQTLSQQILLTRQHLSNLRRHRRPWLEQEHASLLQRKKEVIFSYCQYMGSH